MAIGGKMRKFRCILLALVIIALLVIPAIAASGTSTASAMEKNQKPTPKPDPTTQILTIVTAIQTSIKTLVTSVTSLQTAMTNLQTDVTTLKTGVTTLQTSTDTLQATADEINTKVSGSGIPKEPIRYEYYTGQIEYAQDDFATLDTLTNWGPDTAKACYRKVFYPAGGPWDERSNCIEIPPGKTSVAYPTVVVHAQSLYRVSFNTTSKYVAPQTVFKTAGGTVFLNYNPGDFLKVEVYE
jgi:hypothetical protein